MKIGIYARISTRKQDELNQLDQVRDFAVKQGWEIAFEFVDTVSGSGKKERPQFVKMMLAASQKKFDLLLFWGARQAFPRGHRQDDWLPRRIEGLGSRVAQFHATIPRHRQRNDHRHRSKRPSRCCEARADHDQRAHPRGAAARCETRRNTRTQAG